MRSRRFCEGCGSGVTGRSLSASARSRPCSSPTLLDPLSGLRASETASGPNSSASIIGASGRGWLGSAAARSTRPATVFSRALTAPRVRSGARATTADLADFGLPTRAGIHTGECEITDGKIAGIAVAIGARVAAHAAANEVLVSQTVRDLVAGSGIAFADRGRHQLKGIPGEWNLYAATTD